MTAPAKVIALAEWAPEVIEITELEPNSALLFVGKCINPDGSITSYPKVKRWRQSVVRIPATVPHLFICLREGRKRNVCWIRDAPANLERQPTLRQIAGIGDRGDHGFYDIPNRLIPLDADGVKINWRPDNPEEAIRGILARLGEPWVSTSCVWALSATHGLEIKDYECPTTGKKYKRWTGNIDYSRVRARIYFIGERGLNADEAKALTITAKAIMPELDRSIVDRVNVNYIQRPHWVGHPGRDVLGNIQTIGWIKGTHDIRAVPEDLAYTAHWAKAQGHSSDIANHPDTKSAVRSVGSDGSLRSHLKSAVIHLLVANPIPDVVSFADHSLDVASKLQGLVEQHREQIAINLAAHGRGWSEVQKHLSEMPAWADWCLNHQDILRAKTIKLTKQEPTGKVDVTVSREAIFARVKRIIVRACVKALINKGSEPSVTLLVAPTGSRKSTLLRAAAVLYVTEHPNKTVAILVPRHKLGDEQIQMLRTEHPSANFKAAIWRGRYADDPDSPDPKRPGKFMSMCRRAEDAEAVDAVLLDVESTLCKRGRGEKAVKCPLYGPCAYQQQKQVTANIWFAAHECAAHELPKTLGDVGWVIFDESPLDAFMFGIDINDQITLGLDTLCTPLPVDPTTLGGKYPTADYGQLMLGREELYHALDKLPTELHRGAALPLENLEKFVSTAFGGSIPFILNGGLATIINTALAGTNNTILIRGGGIEPDHCRTLAFRCKVDPADLSIRPDMSKEELKIKLQEATVNSTIKKEVTLWELIKAIGNKSYDIRDVPVEQLKTMLQDAAVDGTIDKEVPLWELIDIPIHRGIPYGRIQVQRGKGGRVIRMVGLEKITKGWNVPTLICDATGDAELLKAIWPQLEEPEPHGWEQLPRPENVRIFQCVNRTISKGAVAVEGKDEGKNSKKLKQQIEGAQRLYAAVLVKALEYGGANVGVITYKLTREWIEKNCFVPNWMKIVHWGEHAGTNTLQTVRALFVIGRPQAPPEVVTQQGEALFGAHIPQREYIKWLKGGRIPIAPDAAGNNCILVDVWKHPHPMAERLRRQITEGAIIHAIGRARAGLRKADEPLDLHLWTDVPVPELGPVEPMLWGELKGGLDGLMLAVAGVWLRNISDAVQAFRGLFSADGLRTARRGGGVGVFVYRGLYRRNTDSSDFSSNLSARSRWLQTDRSHFSQRISRSAKMVGRAAWSAGMVRGRRMGRKK